MAESSWPSPDNGRAVDDIMYEQLSAHNTEDGLWPHPSGNFVDLVGGPVYADGSTPANVKIRANQFANVRGFGWTSGTEDITLPVPANGSGAQRIDRVVLELDRSTWNVRSKIVTGTPGSGSLPALTRNQGPTGVYQVPVARVYTPSSGGIPGSGVYVDGFRIGSRIRPWVNAADMIPTVVGEIGFDYQTRNWFGWNGAQRITLHADTGWIDLPIAWPTVFEKVGTNACRNKNGHVFVEIQQARVNVTLGVTDPDGSMLLQLPSSCWPTHAWVYGTGIFTNGSVGRLIVKGNGEVWIDNVTQTVPVGAYLRTHINFLRD